MNENIEWVFKWVIGVIFGYRNGKISLKRAGAMLKKSMEMGLKKDTINLLINMVEVYTKKSLKELRQEVK